MLWFEDNVDFEAWNEIAKSKPIKWIIRVWHTLKKNV